MKHRYLLFCWVLCSFGYLITSCNESTQPSSEQTTSTAPDYLTEGADIAAASFAALSSRLQAAMKSGGVPHAVEYCSVAALPLVDSLSEVHQVHIKRVSPKYRNPADAPNATESAVFAKFAAQHEAGNPPTPTVLGRQYYSPIFIASPCLSCHGKLGETLDSIHYQNILTRYPTDKAIGYQVGDLRGMWVVTFPEKQ